MRRRLLLTTLGSSVVCWLVSLAVVVSVAWHETSDVFDDALEEGARLAIQLGDSLQRDGRLADDDTAVDPSRHRVRLAYQLISNEGAMLRRADRAPRLPFVAKPDEDEDFHNVWADGKLWRVYVRQSEDRGFAVQIGQRWDDRSELLSEMAENLVWPALGLLLLLGLLNWFAIRSLLQPLERIAQHIKTKSPDDLSAVPDAGQARELQSIILSLNAVFGRLAEAMHAERRFTADAAHELRTPLAALRMKIQLMQRMYRGPVDAAGNPVGDAAPDSMKTALQVLRDDVDRSTSLVENLLALARLDPQQPQTLDKQDVDLQSLMDEVVQVCTPAAQAKTMMLNVALPTTSNALTIRANRPLLASALRNLVDNAVRYGATGGRVRIEVETRAHRLRIAVRDNGPGVSKEDRVRLTQRFFRVLGSGETGSGLGLSIVARIVVLHGGELSFDDGLDGRGLSVRVDLPVR
ncbi:HAMP domain-containing protein [Pigmentiphaga aceris]|uniref:histidine kinase n=1 Tax=Pigmentiphaga aceris TaxID=1940612 RepID=A0A5C0B6A4_9BURK|nr:HAMP domain-containing protein [Pigmentiphaga aceris]